MKVSRAIVPSFFTVGNMFFGFYSMMLAFNGQFILASWMIFVAAFLDAIDGKIARFTGTSSRFGVEYDSLADVISFGLAPSFLIYTTYFHRLKMIGIFISFLPLLFGSIRLARFNVQLKDFDKDYFNGLPIPIAALALSSYIIFSSYFFEEILKYPQVVITLIFIVSLLMISNVRYDTFPKMTWRGDKQNRIKVIIILISAILLLLFPRTSLFPLIILYIAGGVVRWIFSLSSTEVINGESKN